MLQKKISRPVKAQFIKKETSKAESENRLDQSMIKVPWLEDTD